MLLQTPATISLVDYHPNTDHWSQEILTGLQQPQKRLPSKLFYDEKGSRLFDQICKLPDYYPTRTEQAIMERHIEDMVAHVGAGCLLIEYGSGSSQKTRTLLDHLPRMAGYIPIDISREHLMQSAANIAGAYPHLEVLPVCADYDTDFQLPLPGRPVFRRLIYYPGSTIGNFHPSAAIAFLRRMKKLCGPAAELLIGVDLKKDKTTLNRAYNDRAGITARFNLNILARLNREFEADFNLSQFRHYAYYNEAAGRIEMHLVSLIDQQVNLQGQLISFETGECIWTESSYKYTPEAFASLAAQAGFNVVKIWTDDNNLFSVQYLK